MAVEVGPLRQVEDLPGDFLGNRVQRCLTGKGDWFHATLPSYAPVLPTAGAYRFAAIQLAYRAHEIRNREGIDPRFV